jgi:SAM-dependent methyltransferase
MESAEGARSFLASGNAYDMFMGRYSRSLAQPFAAWAGVATGQSALDVGCGPGALTDALVRQLGASSVSAFDPSPPFVEECARRFPSVDVRHGRAEAIPFDNDQFDAALAQLVLHFTTEPPGAAEEMRRVVRTGGIVAACVWDFDDGMQMLRRFWDAALAVDPNAPDEAQTMKFGGAGEIADLFRGVGLIDVEETMVSVTAAYADYDEFWSGFMAGIGPAGAYCLSLTDTQRTALSAELFNRIGSPTGKFSLPAAARCAKARVPR